MRSIFFKTIIFILILSFYNQDIYSQNNFEKELAIADNNQKLLMYKQYLSSECNLYSIKCANYAKQMEKLAISQKNDDLLMFAYSKLAKMYYMNRNFVKSIKYFEKEISLKAKYSNTEDIAELYYNLGSTCFKLKKYSKAQSNFNLSVEYAKKNSDDEILLANYYALVQTYNNTSRYRLAYEYLNKYNELKNGKMEEEINLFKYKYNTEKSAKESNIRQLSKTKNTLKESKVQLNDVKADLDSTSSELSVTQATVGELEIDTTVKNLRIADLNLQSRLSELEIAQNEKIISKNNQIVFILAIGISIVAILALFLYRLFLNKKKMNLQILESKREIETKNSHITKSITYASKIQKALLPLEQNFEEYFKAHFIFFKPRDIVSGDFYFMQKINEYVIFSAVDCTGHGVPGAFMSMLGISYLNDIVRKQGVTSSSQVLDLMRDEVKKALQQTGKQHEQKDGMDMVLCVLNTNTNELQFAGAHNSLILIRNNELTEIKGDRMPIGIYRKEKPFTNHLLKIEKGDKVYLYSDGFQDQMGGEKNVKYKSKPFKNFLLQTSNLDMRAQRDRIESEFNTWKADYDQIDDIVVLGMEF